MRLNHPAVRIALAAALVSALALTGCAKPAEQPSEPAPAAAEPKAIRIGTLATQDSLPLWVAEEKGYFADEKLPKVEIVTFQAAQEEQAAFASGAIDAMMTDVIVPANLEAAGVDVRLATVMLGADTAQGRFAVVAAPGSSAKTIADLKGVPVGTATATITEYVLDKLMEEAGVAEADIKKEEVKKMPVRFQLLMAGKLKAASLPEPFVTLAQQGGATIVEGGDDTKAAENISQSVLCVSEKYLADDAGKASLDAVLAAWDSAVADINANPADFRQTLVDKAMLPKPLAANYAVSEYPKATPPAAEDIQRVLEWMKAKGYLKADVTPQDLLGK